MALSRPRRRRRPRPDPSLSPVPRNVWTSAMSSVPLKARASASSIVDAGRERRRREHVVRVLRKPDGCASNRSPDLPTPAPRCGIGCSRKDTTSGSMPTASGISSTPETVTGCVSPNPGIGILGQQRLQLRVRGDRHRASRRAGGIGRAAGPFDLPPGHVEQGVHRRQRIDVVAAQQRGEDPGAAGEHDDHHRGSAGSTPSVADQRARGSPGTSTRTSPENPGSACSMNAKNCAASMSSASGVY